MKKNLLAVFAIARATLTEAMRSRVLMVSLLFGVVLIFASVTVASVSLGAQTRIIIDVGMAAASALGSLIAVALSITNFTNELNKRTAYPVLARPISRWVFVLGKFTGLWVAMIFSSLIMVASTALTLLLHGCDVPFLLLPALLLTITEMALVVAIALLFAVQSGTVLGATYAAGIILAGNLAAEVKSYAERVSDEQAALSSVLKTAYSIIPDLQKLSLRNELANALLPPPHYLSLSIAYGFCYTALALLLTMLIFSRRTSI